VLDSRNWWWQDCGDRVGVGLCAGAAMGAAQAPVAVPPAAAAKPAEPTVMANPAIWRVKGKHGTVYLFGSVHVMKPNVQWETPKVKSAFDASDLLYLEVANLDDTAALQPMLLPRIPYRPRYPKKTWRCWMRR
jgi:hypothetical protein